MPAFKLGARTIVKRETVDLEFELYEEDGTTEVVLAATDQCRFKMWNTADSAPDLDLSETATANDSVVTITDRGTADTTPATVKVRLAQGDTGGLTTGRYNFELAVVDDSETAPVDAYKVACVGQIQVKPSATGDRDKV